MNKLAFFLAVATNSSLRAISQRSTRNVKESSEESWDQWLITSGALSKMVPAARQRPLGIQARCKKGGDYSFFLF